MRHFVASFLTGPQRTSCPTRLWAVACRYGTKTSTVSGWASPAAEPTSV